jgi:hypothetical protein
LNYNSSLSQSIISVQSTISPSSSTFPSPNSKISNHILQQQQQQQTPKRFQENISVGRGMLMLPLREKMSVLLSAYHERKVQGALWEVESEYLKKADQLLIEERNMRKALLGWSCRWEGNPGPFVIKREVFVAPPAASNSTKKISSYFDEVRSRQLLLQQQQQQPTTINNNSFSSVKPEPTSENLGGVIVQKKKTKDQSQQQQQQDEFTEDFVVAVMSAINSDTVSASWSSMMMSFL